ncbi:unnamed protein product (mitochondrion) [Plasmodiophora brassicae]|uniref:ShKT domain-containing protein n=1 Tax=Plasmodiophora brassicae TaxID=37360 RepID=A0A3P3YCB4_PLABS|nr:unnamed protein product [Plasmodiophora brassicae]
MMKVQMTALLVAVMAMACTGALASEYSDNSDDAYESHDGCFPVDPTASKKWCIDNCHNPERVFCPSDFCSKGCAPHGYEQKSVTELSHSSQDCFTISPIATTEWCHDNCHNTPPYCPSDLCSPGCAPAGYTQRSFQDQYYDEYGYSS